MTEATKISVVVDEETQGFATLLPAVAAPWCSIGNHESLKEIGRLLDNLPSAGSATPAWEAAQSIVELFQNYIKPGGAYNDHYNLHSPEQYAPGQCLASPIYDGVYDRWQLFLLLVTEGGETIEVLIGLINGNEGRRLVVDLKTPNPEASRTIRRNLDELQFEWDELADSEIVREAA